MRIFFASLLLAGAQSLCAQPRFDVDVLLSIPRVSDPAISPDGRLVAFVVQTPDVAQNTKPTQIWIVPIQGGEPRQITHDGSANERPRFMPDARHIAYVSDRGGTSQIWTMDTDGQNQRQLTNLSTEAGGVLISPDGKKLVFTSVVFPECGA